MTALTSVAALYFGRTILMPLALALLVTFAMTPLVERLERRHFGRAPAVIAVCLLIGVFASGMIRVVGRQAASLANDMPQYRTALREEIQELRGPIGSLSGAAAEITRLGDAIEPAARGAQSCAVGADMGFYDNSWLDWGANGTSE